MIIRINPLDTFFFRDGKPFEMGDEAWADGVFPPSPSVIYGALRTLFFAHNDNFGLSKTDLDELTKNFKIKGVFIEIDGEPCLPIPKDIVSNKETKKLHFLDLKDNSSVNSCGTEKMLLSSELSEEVKGLINTTEYPKFLAKGEIQDINPFKDFIKSEYKIGIARNKSTLTTEEGKLYRVEMQRFDNQKYKKIQIIVVFEGLELPERYISKIGGEGKMFSYELDNLETPENGFIEPPNEIENNIFRVCLTTPALFEKGWLPCWVGKNMEGTVPNTNLKLKLITASVGKPISLGGFDVKEKKPKEMNKYVPAGAVYYFKILEGTFEEAVKCFHFQSISELNTAKEGFGITYIGK